LIDNDKAPNSLSLQIIRHQRPPTTSIAQRRHVWGSKNSHKSGRSIFHCCWNNLPFQSTALEIRRLLKTHMYCWRQRHLVNVAFTAPM